MLYEGTWSSNSYTEKKRILYIYIIFSANPIIREVSIGRYFLFILFCLSVNGFLLRTRTFYGAILRTQVWHSFFQLITHPIWTSGEVWSASGVIRWLDTEAHNIRRWSPWTVSTHGANTATSFTYCFVIMYCTVLRIWISNETCFHYLDQNIMGNRLENIWL